MVNQIVLPRAEPIANAPRHFGLVVTWKREGVVQVQLLRLDMAQPASVHVLVRLA